ncbi:MAG: phospholipase D-like domain-containing protein [Candidatus Gracilibacteria bacterium]
MKEYSEGIKKDSEQGKNDIYRLVDRTSTILEKSSPLSKEERAEILQLLNQITSITKQKQLKNISFFKDRIQDRIQQYFPNHPFLKDIIQFSHKVELLSDGKEAFEKTEKLIREAKNSIEVHMFLWKNDPVGDSIMKALLEKARQGVRVTIYKDMLAAPHELKDTYSGSMLHTSESVLPLVQSYTGNQKIPTAKRLKSTYFSELEQLANTQKNVKIIGSQILNDHSKFLITDNSSIIIGDMNYAHEYKHKWRGFMMGMYNSTLFVQHFKERWSGKKPSTFASVEVSLNTHPNTPSEKNFEIKKKVLTLLSQASKSVVIEMAYLGDKDISQALVNTAKRGVIVDIIIPKNANIQQNLNMREANKLLEAASRNKIPLHIYLYPKMTHAKSMLVDNRISFLGSANFNPSSMQQLGETNLYMDDADSPFTKEFSSQLQGDKAISSQMLSVQPFDSRLAMIEEDPAAVKDKTKEFQTRGMEKVLEIFNPISLSAHLTSIFLCLNQRKDPSKAVNNFREYLYSMTHESVFSDPSINTLILKETTDMYFKFKDFVVKFSKKSLLDVMIGEAKSAKEFIAHVARYAGGDPEAEEGMRFYGKFMSSFMNVSPDLKQDMKVVTTNMSALLPTFTKKEKDASLSRNMLVVLLCSTIGAKGVGFLAKFSKVKKMAGLVGTAGVVVYRTNLASEKIKPLK